MPGSMSRHSLLTLQFTDSVQCDLFVALHLPFLKVQRPDSLQAPESMHFIPFGVMQTLRAVEQPRPAAQSAGFAQACPALRLSEHPHRPTMHNKINALIPHLDQANVGAHYHARRAHQV
jgi:hypothetical protein